MSDDGKKQLLFLCIHNSARSQMAAAFLSRIAGPIFPGFATRLNWSFADPSTFTASEAARLEQTIAVRDQIRRKVDDWVAADSHSH